MVEFSYAITATISTIVGFVAGIFGVKKQQKKTDEIIDELRAMIDGQAVEIKEFKMQIVELRLVNEKLIKENERLGNQINELNKRL